MKIMPGHAPGASSERRGPTFTGTVWADPVLPVCDGVVINHVFFTPGARTHWHRHERGQVLHVTSGVGWALTRDGDGGEIRSGDVVWFAPGEEHWHGACSGRAMSHLAISLGTTEWLDAVADGDYERGQEPGG